MPYSIVNDHPECDGFAVIKDSSREVMGCHRTRPQAQNQLTALNIAEYGNRADAPAPAEDQVKGSDKNEPGSAAGKSGDISISAETEKALQNKADEHNAAMKDEGKPNWTRVRVGALRSVYRRGAGAYSTSHRPGIGRAQWAMARVNAFLYLARTGAPKNKAYIGDNDLLNSDHPRYSAKKNRELPENYRPASSDDVPEGRNCGNCYFYEAGYCELWDENVQADYYCNRWAQVIERQESYAPTASMQAEARRGLAWRRELGRGGTAIGLARARDIAGGKNLPLETIRRMVSFFARHEVDKEAQGFRPGEDGYPSNGRIAWALWGGDAGKSWADRISKANQTRLDHARNILDILRKSEIE